MDIDLKQTILQAKILHAAMFIGVILFAMISYAIHNFMDAGGSLAILPANAIYPVILLAAAMLWVGSLIYKKGVSGIDKNLSLEERVTYFRKAALLRVALIEAASLTVITGYLLSGDLYYLALALIPLLFFANTFPRDDEIIEAINLSYSERQQLI